MDDGLNGWLIGWLVGWLVAVFADDVELLIVIPSCCNGCRL